MAGARLFHQATLLQDGRVLITGGANLASLASAELYDPASNTFSPTGGLQNARQLHTATRLGSGLVLVAGGAPAFQSLNAVAEAELYDPAMGTFRSAGALLFPRQRHTATPVSPSDVVLIGGHRQQSVTGAERYHLPTVLVTLAPTSVTLARQGRTSFTATVIGATDPGATYSTSGGGITAAGLYTAPDAAGSYTVTACSVEAPTSCVSAAVTVVDQVLAPTGFSDHTETLLDDGTILFAGGVSTPFYYYARPATAAAWLYDPTPGTITATGSLRSARALHTATPLPDGSVLIAGGEQGGLGSLDTSERYLPAARAFVPAAPLQSARQAHSATRLADGSVLVAGGYDGARAQALLRSAEIYDPAADRFLPTGSLARSRQHHSATLLLDGRVLIAGGYGDRGITATAEIYDPASGTFTPTGPLVHARFLHRATRLLDGRVLITGGAASTAAGSAALADCELYDPAIGQFRAAGSLQAPRYQHSATLLAPGQVLLAGGFSRFEDATDTALGRVELYDPISGQFIVNPALTTPRARHSATLLGDGRVALAGGHDQSNVTAIELYRPTLPVTGARFIIRPPLALGSDARDAVAADLDGDPIPDLVTLNPGSGEIVLLRGGGDGSFAPLGRLSLGLAPTHLAAGDLDGDGRTDLLVSDSGIGLLWMLHGLGGGTFGPVESYAAGVSPGSVTLADLDHDQRLDVLVADEDGGTLRVLRGNGSGTLDAAGIYAAPVPAAVAAADLNGDGHLDAVVVSSGAGLAAVYLGNGDATFQAMRSVALPAPAADLQVADFDRDGRLDLAAVHPATGRVSLLLGRGDGGFQPALSSTVGRTPVALAAGDFNRDGVLDLASADRDDGRVSVLPGRGDGTFGRADVYAVGVGPRQVRSLDVNGDGRPDLVVVNEPDQSLVVLVNSAP
jgi:hypothetical protein